MSYSNNNVGKQREPVKKVVRFASESETLSSGKLDTDSVHSSSKSADIITWIPSEQLYSDDTFISDSPKDYTTDGSVPSYDSNTFIDLDSEDDTATLTNDSYTDSFASSGYTDSLDSSGIFSTHSQSDRTASRERVRDIEELEVSNLASSLDRLSPDHSEEDEIRNVGNNSIKREENSRRNFLLNTVQKLKLKDLQSPRSLDEQVQFACPGPSSKEKIAFYQKMIDSCQKTKMIVSDQKAKMSDSGQKAKMSDSGQKAKMSDSGQKAKLAERCSLGSQHLKTRLAQPPAHYGLSPNIVDRLKNNNFKFWLEKKMADIDRDTQESQDYVNINGHIEDEFRKQQFLKQMRAFVLQDNIDDNIQMHLINTDPNKWFSEFISALPNLRDQPK